MDLPTYITDELRLRLIRNGEDASQIEKLGPDQIKALAQRLGIDLKTSLSPPPSVEEAATHALLANPGGAAWAVEFDLTLEALGARAIHRARVSYAVEDDPLARAHSYPTSIEVLLWEFEDRGNPGPDFQRAPYPTWREIPLFQPPGFFPQALIDGIDELIEDAISGEEGKKSNA